jgi:hypothetical protein
VFSQTGLKAGSGKLLYKSNAEEVVKVTTGSGSIGYIAASVPVAAFKVLLRRLD